MAWKTSLLPTRGAQQTRHRRKWEIAQAAGVWPGLRASVPRLSKVLAIRGSIIWDRLTQQNSNFGHKLRLSTLVVDKKKCLRQEKKKKCFRGAPPGFLSFLTWSIPLSRARPNALVAIGNTPPRTVTAWATGTEHIGPVPSGAERNKL